MNIITCPNCKMRVLPKSDGICPSCQALIAESVSESIGPQDGAANPPGKPPPPPKVNRLLGKASIPMRKLPFLERGLARALKGFGIGILIFGGIVAFFALSGRPVAIGGGEILSLVLAGGVYCAIIGFCGTKPDPVNHRISILLVVGAVITTSVGVYLYASVTGTNNKPADIITMTVISALLPAILCSVEQMSDTAKK